MNLLNLLWDFVNSPIGLMLVASAVVFLVNLRWAKPGWKKFEGTIIAAVAWAEKTIPDNAENKSVKRLDEALKYVLKVHREMTSRSATAKEVADLREGIQIIHADLQAKGVLKQP